MSTYFTPTKTRGRDDYKSDKLPKTAEGEFDFHQKVATGAVIVIQRKDGSEIHRETVDKAKDMEVGVAVRYAWMLSSESADILFLMEIPRIFSFVERQDNTWYFKKVA